jgi:hypothetical protein
VAEHQDLQVLGGVAAGQQVQQLDRAAERQVGERWPHAGSLRDGSAEAPPCRAVVERTGSSQATSDVAHPTGSGHGRVRAAGRRGAALRRGALGVGLQPAPRAARRRRRQLRHLARVGPTLPTGIPSTAATSA